MAFVTWVIVLLSETNRPNDSETHQEDISKYRSEQVEWPQDDPNEEHNKSNQIRTSSIAPKCVLKQKYPNPNPSVKYCDYTTQVLVSYSQTSAHFKHDTKGFCLELSSMPYVWTSLVT